MEQDEGAGAIPAASSLPSALLCWLTVGMQVPSPEVTCDIGNASQVACATSRQKFIPFPADSQGSPDLEPLPSGPGEDSSVARTLQICGYSRVTSPSLQAGLGPVHLSCHSTSKWKYQLRGDTNTCVHPTQLRSGKCLLPSVLIQATQATCHRRWGWSKGGGLGPGWQAPVWGQAGAGIEASPPPCRTGPSLEKTVWRDAQRLGGQPTRTEGSGGSVCVPEATEAQNHGACREAVSHTLSLLRLWVIHQMTCDLGPFEKGL